MATHEAEFELTEVDLRRYAGFLLARQNARWIRSTASRVLLGVIAVLLGLLAALVALGSALAGGLGWLGIILADPVICTLLFVLGIVAALALLVQLVMPRMAARQFRRSRLLQGPHRLQLSDDGVHSRTPHSEGTLAWTAFDGLVREGDDLYLMLSPHQALFVPARAFADESSRAAFEARCRDAIQTGA